MTKTDLKFDRSFFRDFWQLFKPYWVSNEKWSAYALLGLNIIFTVGGVQASVALNIYSKNFYDALQNFNKAALMSALLHIAGVAVALIISYGYAFYFNGLLGMRWRRWLTTHYLNNWLHNRTYYHMQHQTQHIDNPDQRISEDLEMFSDATLVVFFIILQSTLTLFSFGFILWGMSANFSFNIATWHIVLPGYLLWSALLYGALGTCITGLIGKKLAGLDYRQQLYNADFRYSLVRFRESSEQIALYRGEAAEKVKFTQLFGQIYANFIDIIALKKYLTFFTSGYNSLAVFVGVFLAIPLYLQKKVQMGGMMQVSGAFSAVLGALSLFIHSYGTFAAWRAVVGRLAEFNRSICDASLSTHTQINVAMSDNSDIRIQHLTLLLPNGKLLLQNINLVFQAGGSFLLSGQSGIGKSTLLRACASLWPYGAGQITLPKNKQLFFLPQKPYMPLGSLRDLLLYPSGNNVSDEQLQEILGLCRLTSFQQQLAETKNWSQALSLGEQQLIAFARVLICKPDIIFLDEATSALDEQAEAQLYQQLRVSLPMATIVSVGHRSSLHGYHDRVIQLVGDQQQSNSLLQPC